MLEIAYCVYGLYEARPYSLRGQSDLRMLDSPPESIAYNSLKSFSLVWLAQLELALWAYIQAEYSMNNTLDNIEDFLDELVLETIDLSLGVSIGTSLEPALNFTELDMAEVEVKMFEFTISLLGAIMQDGSMRERSVVTYLFIIQEKEKQKKRNIKSRKINKKKKCSSLSIL